MFSFSFFLYAGDVEFPRPSLCSLAHPPPSLPPFLTSQKEDRFTQHRYKADQAFLVGADKSPVGAYLDIDSIIQTAKKNGVDAIHPGREGGREGGKGSSSTTHGFWLL